MLQKKFKILIDYLKGKSLSVNKEDVDIDYLIKILKYHALLPMLYKACMQYEIVLTKEQNDYLQSEYMTALYKEATQEEEKKLLLTTFDKAGIKCAPLKGSILKYLYPTPEVRTMCDLDILYDKTKTSEVDKILKGFGYTLDSKGNHHDVYQKKPFMDVEMHHHLISESFNVIREYYDNIWDVITPYKEGSNIYIMSHEDFYVFMIVHIAKHFKGGGVGIRYLFDTYLYLNKYQPELNFDYINGELKKLDLNLFESNFRGLVEAWFNDLEFTKLQEDLIKFIVESATHGTTKHVQAVELTLGKNGSKALSTSKFKYIMRKAFPTYATMKMRNPILKKLPILLPFFYISRLFMAMFKRRDYIKTEITGIDKFKYEEVKEIKDLHEKTGI